MSLNIDSRYITGIYALGQWFKVKKGSVDVDSFEFRNWEEDDPHDGNIWNTEHTNYQMGDIYGQTSNPCNRYRLNPEARAWFSSVSPCHGMTFIDAVTGERVSISLTEVRAFREDRK